MTWASALALSQALVDDGVHETFDPQASTWQQWRYWGCDGLRVRESAFASKRAEAMSLKMSKKRDATASIGATSAGRKRATGRASLKMRPGTISTVTPNNAVRKTQSHSAAKRTPSISPEELIAKGQEILSSFIVEADEILRSISGREIDVRKEKDRLGSYRNSAFQRVKHLERRPDNLRKISVDQRKEFFDGIRNDIDREKLTAESQIYSHNYKLKISSNNPRIIDVVIALESYVKEHNLDGFARYAEEALHELLINFDVVADRTSQGKLPERAPEVYQGLRGPETPPSFVQRVYGPWLGQGLTRAHIRKLDPKLYTAIDNWLSRKGNEWPSDVDLPTKSQQVDRKVDKLRAGEAVGEFTLREMQRMSAAVQRRRNNDISS